MTDKSLAPTGREPHVVTGVEVYIVIREDNTIAIYNTCSTNGLKDDGTSVQVLTQQIRAMEITYYILAFRNLRCA